MIEKNPEQPQGKVLYDPCTGPGLEIPREGWVGRKKMGAVKNTGTRTEVE